MNKGNIASNNPLLSLLKGRALAEQTGNNRGRCSAKTHDNNSDTQSVYTTKTAVLKEANQNVPRLTDLSLKMEAGQYNGRTGSQVSEC
jgi:hypothetical protein